MFRPIRVLSVKLLHNGNVGHRRGWRGAVPMFLAGRNPDNVAWPDFLHRSAPKLNSAATCCHDQSLAQWMGVPCGTRSALEGHAGAYDACRIGRAERGVNPHRAKIRPILSRKAVSRFV